ncbi:Inner membrane protein YccS [Corallococcus coralloides]|uniref:Inner membrane protein YccS n=1 Tax=Corallococcus coralloides TaxID=184914 RepID=A0A410RZ29_CORCK|nr:FUSC family protein [Corallococcus coralloides]QAT87051.1 Inner membrane protein YccS [Corallococcus coralloides]
MRHRLRRHLQSLLRVDPGRPALWAGIRAAVATALPLCLAFLTTVPQAGWAGLTGLLVTLADKGGSYRVRARVMGVVTVLGALVGLLAAPAGHTYVMDATLLLVGVTAANFARCYGETAGSVGGQLAVIFVVSLGAPAASPREALLRGAALLLGGLWAMALSLLLWPLRPYRPARRAVAQVYAGLAIAAEDLGRATRDGATAEAWAAGLMRHARLRPDIERARDVLAATRRGRPDESRRGEHLLVLVELVEPMVALLSALAEAMQVVGRDPHMHATRERVIKLCEAFGAMDQWVSRALLQERNEGMREPARLALRPRRRQPARMAAPPVRQSAEGPLSTHVATLLDRLREHAGVAHETASGLLFGDPVSARSRGTVGGPRQTPGFSLWRPVRDHLHPDSVVLRHALRTGMVATAALGLTRALQVGDAHWVSLVVISILQPYAGSTEERVLQRTLGTLLGASLAALIATLVHTPPMMIGVISVLTAISVALLPLNFGAFQVLLTPDYLLMATLSSGDWTVASQRSLGVLIAGALALVGSWTLWPSPERRRFPDAAASALRADGKYLQQLATHRSGTEPAVNEERRLLDQALLEAESSFQRLMTEYRGPPGHLEPGMALLTYARRFALAVTALGTGRFEGRTTSVLPQQLAQRASDSLELLARALQERREPPPLPALALPRTSDDPVLGALLERVPRQLGILHGAVARISEDPSLR